MKILIKTFESIIKKKKYRMLELPPGEYICTLVDTNITTSPYNGLDALEITLYVKNSDIERKKINEPL